MRKILLGSLLAMVLACGGDGGNEPSVPDPEGQWNGPINTSVGSGNLALTLNGAAGNVTGSGTLTVPGDAISLTVTGNHAHPDISLQLSSPGFEPMNLGGTMSDTQIQGVLNGSGFVNIAVTLTRQ
jgi:hypothetical protein